MKQFLEIVNKAIDAGAPSKRAADDIKEYVIYNAPNNLQDFRKMADFLRQSAYEALRDGVPTTPDDYLYIYTEQVVWLEVCLIIDRMK